MTKKAMREMRRKERATTKEEALALLGDCEYAVLSMTDPDGNPHAVPVSPVLDGEAVYIHCAPAGYKLDCIAHNPQVCLVCADHITRMPERFSTAFKSTIAYGRATLLTGKDEKIHALDLICRKYALSNMENFDAEMEKSFTRTAVIRVDIENISGKQRKLPQK
ncbi:MAG: pyridoxamine 5'-phosphate oxidase family protein [Christensenella sp.]|uniref:pyridoxamine 5'-phosphate oxidase family protein n=1 Tax=Christensenella sp. TaxID=1935934 RepID=UPI002B1FD507|nr:pyridoxamine 5'-phosphate oxidase family protein [Christensenella sp.]MEA5003593.1 pyridoxamine 5'-phosphate oxidase family protein [Christensenella sp.]